MSCFDLEGLGRNLKGLISSPGHFKLIRNIGALLSANIYSKLTIIISGVLIGRWVAPDDYGIWVALNILPSYVYWMQLGTANGLGRELPLTLGKGDTDAAKAFIGTAFYFHLVVVISSVVLLAILSIFFEVKESAKWSYGLWFIIFYTATTLISGLFYIIARSYRHFASLSALLIVQSTISLLGLWLVKYYSLYGLYYRMFFSQLFLLAGYVFLYRKHIAFKLDTGKLKELIKIGFPIFLAGYVALIFSIADRSLAARYLSSEQLGIYGFALFVYSGVQILSSTICDVLFPEMVLEYSKHENAEILWKTVKKYWIYHLIILPIPITIIWFTIPYLLKAVVPKYVLAAEPAQILLIGGVVWSFTGVLGNFLNCVRKSWSYTLCLGLCTVVFWIGCYIAVKLGYGLKGLAWANVFSVGVFFISTFIVASSFLLNEENHKLSRFSH